MESWRNFKAGDRVKVVRSGPVPKTSWVVLGRYGVFVEFTKYHGYAKVQMDEGGIVLVHPEELSLDNDSGKGHPAKHGG